jgi:hypothetical protein
MPPGHRTKQSLRIQASDCNSGSLESKTNGEQTVPAQKNGDAPPVTGPRPAPPRHGLFPNAALSLPFSPPLSLLSPLFSAMRGIYAIAV